MWIADALQMLLVIGVLVSLRRYSILIVPVSGPNTC